MEMQDKEFDNLFRGKLDNFEMQPSAGAWEGIDRELNADKRRKILIPFLSIAASIVVLVTAGILFIPHKTAVQNKDDKSTLASAPKIATTNRAVKQQAPSVLTTVSHANAIAATVVKHAKSAPIINETPAESHKNVVADEHQDIQNTVTQQPVLASASPAKLPEITAPVTPLADVPVVAKTTDAMPIAQANIPDATTSQQPVAGNKNPAIVKPRHKAHTLGGLLNLAIAQVDKRKDKVIVFAEADDEESDITAINLGIVKIKKEK